MIPQIASGLVDRCISNATYRNQKPWGEATELSSQNSSSWDCQRCPNISPSSSVCSCPWTWSLWWERTHHAGHQLDLQPPHLHVLLHRHPVQRGHMLHLFHCTKNAAKHPNPKPSHPLCGMPHIDVFPNFVSRAGHCPLAVMAYDIFVAICHPLYYATTTRPQYCITSVPLVLIVTNIYPLIHTVLMSTLSFCTSVRIHHIFCELYANSQHLL